MGTAAVPLLPLAKLWTDVFGIEVLFPGIFGTRIIAAPQSVAGRGVVGSQGRGF